MKRFFLLILPFLFLPLLVYSVEETQYVVDHDYGDVEQKDIDVLTVRTYNHFVCYQTIIDGDTSVVIALRSPQSDSLAGKTINNVSLRKMNSFRIPFWSAETSNLHIGYFSCEGDTIYFDHERYKIYLQDDKRIKYVKWSKTITSKGDTIEVSEEYPNKRRQKLK